MITDVVIGCDSLVRSSPVLSPIFFLGPGSAAPGRGHWGRQCAPDRPSSFTRHSPSRHITLRSVTGQLTDKYKTDSGIEKQVCEKIRIFNAGTQPGSARSQTLRLRISSQACRVKFKVRRVRRVPVVGRKGDGGPLRDEGDAADEELGAIGERRCRRTRPGVGQARQRVLGRLRLRHRAAAAVRQVGEARDC